MAGALAMAASAASAQVAAIRDCLAPPGGVSVALPFGLPPALRDAMVTSLCQESRLTRATYMARGINIAGATAADDILNRIFSTFCLGK